MDTKWLQYADAGFRVSTSLFFVLLAIEYIEPGFATNWFHPAWLLVPAVGCGVVVVRSAQS